MALYNDGKDQGARNWRGEESEQSKERRRRKKRSTTEGLVKGLQERKGRVPTKMSEEYMRKVRNKK